MKAACLIVIGAVLSGCSGGYVVRNGQVSYSVLTENGRISTVAEGAKADGFTQLANGEYGKDQRRVYWRGSLIYGADPSTFEPLTHLYSRDKAKVFWRDRMIKNADRDTFVVVDGPKNWSRDARDVFCADDPIGVKRPDKFHVLDASWATDGEAYYYIRQFSPKGQLNSEYKSTRLLNGDYAVDGHNAYFHTRIIPGADAATFRPLNECYALDARHAYFEAKPIYGADVGTFRQEGLYKIAKDRFRTYVFGKPQ